MAALVALFLLAAEVASPWNVKVPSVALHGHDPVAFFAAGGGASKARPSSAPNPTAPCTLLPVTPLRMLPDRQTRQTRLTAARSR